MSELKAHTYDDMLDGNADVDVKYYLKSEADKVIADLEESHKMEVEQLLMEIVKLKEEKSMCKYCRFGGRGKFKGRTPDFLILQDRFALKIEKDEPYVGDYGLTVSDNEDECEFTVAINFCPMCGRKLTQPSTEKEAPMPCNGKKSGGKKPPKK